MINRRNVEWAHQRFNYTSFILSYLRFTMLPLLVFILLPVSVSCGRRGDPIAVTPYTEVAVIKHLKASIVNDNIYLTWGMPEGKNFPEKALKGFVIFRAEVPVGVSAEECKCEFRSLDFIVPDRQKTFNYLDKNAIKGQSYIYKIIVMDKNNKMSKDSDSVFVSWAKPKLEDVIVPLNAPAGFIALYTQNSVVLTWDEIQEQEVKFYRVYRSEDKDFVAIGETATPAFTDKNIEPSKKYYYRVTAVGKVESLPSKEIEIVTKGYQP